MIKCSDERLTELISQHLQNGYIQNKETVCD